MEHAKKMILVPERMVDVIEKQNSQMIAPVSRKLININNDMQSTLEDSNLTDDHKANLYAQLLQRYLVYKDKRNQEIQSPTPVKIINNSLETTEKSVDENHNEAITVPDKDDVGDEILQSVPMTMKKRATHLLSRIKNNPKIINWNSKGELVYQGKTYDGTNVIDLFGDVMRERRNFNPPGADVFIHGLSEINTPQEWIGNETRRNTMMKYLQDAKLSPAYSMPSLKSKKPRSTPYKRTEILSSPPEIVKTPPGSRFLPTPPGSARTRPSTSRKTWLKL